MRKIVQVFVCAMVLPISGVWTVDRGFFVINDGIITFDHLSSDGSMRDITLIRIEDNVGAYLWAEEAGFEKDDEGQLWFVTKGHIGYSRPDGLHDRISILSIDSIRRRIDGSGGFELIVELQEMRFSVRCQELILKDERVFFRDVVIDRLDNIPELGGQYRRTLEELEMSLGAIEGALKGIE